MSRQSLPLPPSSSLSSSLNKQFLNYVNSYDKAKKYKRSAERNNFGPKRFRRPKRSYFSDQQSTSGFHPFMQSSQTIEFLSTFNFSDPIDGLSDRHSGNFNSEDPTPIVPVTEMSDLELRRLGFPVPATTTETSVYSILHGFGGSGSGKFFSRLQPT